MKFKLKSKYKPTGDQPQAINKLSDAIKNKVKFQTLLGVTGSGKTFTMANIINNIQKPTLVISHNKTLAAQLYQEFRDYFPQNAVSYFVSYYDYYQPEAYIPQTDTYIEKETDINEEIDKLRLEATTNLLIRKDVIVVASVSSIYNLGSPKEYKRSLAIINKNQKYDIKSLLSKLINLQYQRTDYEFQRGTFRLKGDLLEIWPSYLDHSVRIDFLNNKVDKFYDFNPITGEKINSEKNKNENKTLIIYPAKHYMTNPDMVESALDNIKKDLKKRIAELKKQKNELEAHRIKQRVEYDLEMINEFGYVNGIENYSRYFDGRLPGEQPNTLLDYFLDCDKNFLSIIDESHITLPQIKGMYNGDQARKRTLIDFGFRLPSALDNRPLKFDEVLNKIGCLLFTSATPGDWELENSKIVVEQLIRPTGLLDPEIIIKNTKNQITDLISEIEKIVKNGERVLLTTLTKRMAEALSDYLEDKNIKVHYLHSDIETLERSDILDNLRSGEYDVIVGINLLREGLDLPEVSLVAILDADKEGFLRSETSLIQTMGRASRHQNGKVIMYADKITGSMKRAIHEVERRRKIQINYNLKHDIVPKSIIKPIREKLIAAKKDDKITASAIKLSKKEIFDFKNYDSQSLTPQDKKILSKKLEKRMNQAAKELDFELAAKIRDTIAEI